MTPTVSLNGVDKAFGAVLAVDGLSLTVEPAEVVALLGPNGAGKSTTISILLGLLAADRGDVELFGDAPEIARRCGRVGVMFQDGGLMRGVLVQELLVMLHALYPTPMPAERALRLSQLDGLEHRRVDRLSGGETQRLRLACALIGDPELLVLDEPTAAMDVTARRGFWATMRDEAGAGRTILFSTHHLEEADAFADRVVVIGAGRILADGSPAQIKSTFGLKVVRFGLTHAHEHQRELATLPGVTGVVACRPRVELRTIDSDATLRALLAAWPDAHDIEVGGAGLEDAFLALTRTAA
jgi:ABC-2 type transport system ATP-binding protein